MGVLASLIGRFVLYDALADPRRHKNCRDTHTQTIEVESVFFAIGSHLSVRVAVPSWNMLWRRDVIGETTVLVKVDDNEAMRIVSDSEE